LHLAKARDVPELCREVTAFFDLFFIESNVLSRWCDPHQTKSHTIGAILGVRHKIAILQPALIPLRLNRTRIVSLRKFSHRDQSSESAEHLQT
jgi:hypothetical protein